MDPLLILLFLFLFILSAFFSGTEIALMSISRHKVDGLLKNGKSGAKALKHIKERNDQLLITILIGNNLVNVYTATLATQIAMGIARGSGIEESLAIGISTGVVTFLLLMFGEIAPKSFATKNAEKIALSVAILYKYLMFVLYPIVIGIEFLIKVFTGKSKADIVTDEEIEAFIDMGKDSGTLDHGEHEKIKNILEFNEIYVEEIMTPRVKIDSLSSDTTIGEAKEYYLKNTHSRLPIYNETIDKIDSFITIRDILAGETKHGLDTKISDLKLSKVLKVPLNQPISSLFDTFKNSRKHLAIVIDEYGGVAGLITLEDVIEEVFGEIRDETDIEVDEIKNIGKDEFEVDPYTLMDDVLDEYDLDFKDVSLDEKDFSGETISYVITHILERFPSKGEKINLDIINEEKDEDDNSEYLEIKVLGIDEGKIENISIRKKVYNYDKAEKKD